MKTRMILLAAVAFTAGCSLPLPNARAQGSLTPPGAPVPTMKTLDQIEARTPVDQTHAPGNADATFVISVPGSYYLTGNIMGVTNLNGIDITADNVTLDLNGFAVIGGTNPAVGIKMPATSTGIRVCNGSLQKWAPYALFAPSSGNCQYDHLRVSQSMYGLYCGNGCEISDCLVQSNSEVGMETGAGCTLSKCTATGNLIYGIAAGSESTLTGCTATFNGYGCNVGYHSTCTGCTASGNADDGFDIAGHCTLKDCTATANNGKGINVATFGGSDAIIVDCNASGNVAGGIYAGNLATVTGCNASENSGDGIAFGTGCFVSGNVADNNTGNGLNATLQINRIDNNMASGNAKAGILWVNDYVVRNSAFLNGTNYFPSVGGGNTGPINAASSSTNPWANF